MTAFEILKLVLVMGAILLGVAAIFGAGLYFIARGLTARIDRQRSLWARTAKELGLEVDDTCTLIMKPLVGSYETHRVSLTSIQPGERSSPENMQVVCEMWFDEPLDVEFHSKTRGLVLQEIVGVVSGYDVSIGVAAFDNAYHIETAAPKALRQMLLFEPENGLRPSIVTDIFLVQKRTVSIALTNVSVKLTIWADVHHTSRIKKVLEDAVMLIDRLTAAREATRVAAS